MANWSSMTGIFEGGNSLGIRPLADDVVVKQYVALLRPVVDVLVVVSHLGLDEDEGLAASEVQDENEALPLEGVDLIMGGHLHIVTNPPKILPHDDGQHRPCSSTRARSPSTSAGSTSWSGSARTTRPGGAAASPAFTYDNIPVDSQVPDDPAVTELLWPYSVAINRDIDLDGVFAFVNTLADTKITRNDLSGGDSQLGNLVARSMQTRSGVEAEFALTNSLGVRADFEQGPLTVEQMFNVFPFENTITVMYLSGSEIQETLDFVARKSADRGCRTQAQVAGIWFDMVCRGDCPDPDPDDDFTPVACAKNVYLGENCRGDNPDGPIDTDICRPVVPNGLYRVAVNDYIAKGGSGFEVLKRNTTKQDTGVSLRDSLTVYLRNQASCAETVIDFTDTASPQRTVVERWGDISCLDESVEPHDGRIRPVFE